MFTIRAGYTDQVEIKASLENVIKFFSDIKNFVEMMPSIESIHTDGGGVTHWRIRVDVPFIGSFKEKFAVQLAEENEDRIEWIPAAGEKQNLLRYSAEFMPKSADSTVVQFSQNAELRRAAARELHPLAGLAGESIISGEMNKGIAQMVKSFVRKAKEKLEK
ncbi:MAG: SRPBCC domain-containing protein [Acidobacteriota bacterium]|nr:SRPBCC domain-containing protein [Acidobacteriota bacterium]